ncbi:MAG TPA: hypothetical protein VMF62_19810 [Acetobacteraceae bacterium]|nr:hypothetical protein [Acetobacteraceae bacterium]
MIDTIDRLYAVEVANLCVDAGRADPIAPALFDGFTVEQVRARLARLAASARPPVPASAPPSPATWPAVAPTWAEVQQAARERFAAAVRQAA